MPPEALSRPLDKLRFGFDLPVGWKPALGSLALAWLLIGVAFSGDLAEIALQAWNSSTYNHILLIPFILAWLVWQRAGEVVKIAPRGWWPGLVLFAGAAFLWLLGAFSGFNFAQHLGVIAMLVLAVPALLGVRVAAALLFPLFYAFMLVPFGDELVPPLQMITAEITIFLTELSGIPAVIEGVFIDTPAGLFEVAEACSGVKFLIAMIAFGLLVGNVCFVSWKRRAIFFAACVIVPIVANGIRAWGTIQAAQWFGIEAAAGFDHIVYGWFFFALVIAIVVAGGWRWFDRPVDEVPVSGEAIAADPLFAKPERATIRPALALGIILAIVVGALLWAAGARALTYDLANAPGDPMPAVPGWERVEYAPLEWWMPRAAGADGTAIARYRNAEGQTVDVFLAVYAGQGEGREAGAFGEGALMPDTNWAWQSAAPTIDGAKGEQLMAGTEVTRVVQTWYRSGDLLSGSNARLKLALTRDRLLLNARPTMTLMLSAEATTQAPAQDPETAIRAFYEDAAPVTEWMDRAAGLR